MSKEFKEELESMFDCELMEDYCGMDGLVYLVSDIVKSWDNERFMYLRVESRDCDNKFIKGNVWVFIFICDEDGENDNVVNKINL